MLKIGRVKKLNMPQSTAQSKRGISALLLSQNFHQSGAWPLYSYLRSSGTVLAPANRRVF